MFDVLLHERLIGALEPRGRGVRFTYDTGVLDDPAVPALSLSLPKQVDPYPDSKAGPFFRNLLPEQAYRRLVAAATAVAPENDLALLGAIGGECPGAVSIWPRGERPASPPEYRAVSESALEGLFSMSSRQEMATALSRGRLSLAGAQEKIAMYRDPQGWWLPHCGAKTSHILKQPSVDFECLLENELFCMFLADAVGLHVASVGLATERVRVFTTERFDRVSKDGTLIRLHQEDLCQALGVDPAHKYEHDGGPGIRQCATMILRHSAAPIVDIDQLARWVGFNYLIGNEDAHAKNLAFLHGDAGTRLAPFYDIVSTMAYGWLERRSSMKIGRAWDARNVQSTDWQQSARDIDLPWPALKEALIDVSERVAANLEDVAFSTAELCGQVPIYETVAQVVRNRRAQLDRELARR